MRSSQTSSSHVPPPAQSRLAILIPTLNGNYFLARAVQAFAEQIESGRFTDVDVVISDNQSDDLTRNIATQLAERFAFVQYIHQDHHYNTAESHIFAAFRQIEHDYVWSFGDDDIPEPGALARIWSLLKHQHYACVFGNPKAFDAKTGDILPGRNDFGGIVPLSYDLDASIEDIVACIGFQTIAACISIVVLDRRMFLKSNPEDYHALSPIYSHVAAYLDAFAGERAIFLAQPTISYRVGATPEASWRRLSEKTGALVHAPWTLGMISLLERLHSRGKIHLDFVCRVVEHTPDDEFFLWVHILHRFVSQLTENLELKILNSSELIASVNKFCSFLSAPSASGGLELGQRVRSLYDLVGRHLSWSFDGDYRSGNDEVREAHMLALRQFIAMEADQIRAALPRPDGLSRAANNLIRRDVGEDVRLADSGFDLHVVNGFSHREDWGRWTDANISKFQVEVIPNTSTAVFMLDLWMGFASVLNGGASEFDMWINDGPLKTIRTTPPSEVHYEITGLTPGRSIILNVCLRVARTKLANDPPLNDHRRLGIGVRSFRIQSTDTEPYHP